MQKQSLMHSSTSHMAPHKCLFPYVSQKVALWAANQSSIVDSAICGGFYKLLQILDKIYTPHMPEFHMPTFAIAAQE